MPTETFFRLPEEKRNRVLEVSTDEFSLHRFDDVSINEIIKKAKISRGSFYQYFADKDDLFNYLIISRQDEMLENWRQEIIAADGDLFAGFHAYSTKLINKEVTEKWRVFHLNMMIFIGDIKEKQMTDDDGPRFSHHGHRYNRRDFALDIIDYSKLRVKDESELIYLIRLMTTLMMQVLNSKLRNVENFDRVEYEKRLDLMTDWLKFGVMKGE